MKTIIRLSAFLILCNIAYPQYQFDSVQVKKIRLVIEENKFLHLENDSLFSQTKLLNRKIDLLKLQSYIKDSIITFHNNKPIVKQAEWYIWLMAVITSLSVGVTTGLLLK